MCGKRNSVLFIVCLLYCLIFWPNSLYCQQAPEAYPPAIEIEWESQSTTTVESQQMFSPGIRRTDSNDSAKPLGPLRLLRSHKLTSYRDEVRYGFEGDMRSERSPGGSYDCVATWVYNSRLNKTRFLDSTTTGRRKFPLGMIYDGNILLPGPDESLPPLVAWLTSSGQLRIGKPTLPKDGNEMEPLGESHNTAKNECIIEWGIPDATTGKAKAHSFQGVSRMAFQVVDGRRVPKSWTMEIRIEGTVLSLVTAKIKQIHFLEDVDSSLFELDFPPGTWFSDFSVIPNIYGVIDELGNVRGSNKRPRDVPYEIQISKNSPIPIVRFGYIARRNRIVLGGVVGLTVLGLCLAVVRWRR
jgi:hypothetical protein